jgi:hypothetical protein
MTPQLRAPDDLFTKLERMLRAHPDRLNMDNYHSHSNGQEAVNRVAILNAASRCLIGWVLALTPDALEFGWNHDDPMELANDVLEEAGKPPLPWGIVMGTREDAMRLIKGRAAEEKALYQ